MEQPRRHRLVVAALIVCAALGAAAAAAALSRDRPVDRVEGHAFAIPSGDDRTVVEVLNASGRPGLARTATRMLRRQGIDVVFLGNADTTLDSTEIVVRRGDSTRALRVAELVGASRTRVEHDTLRRIDASVLLGHDFTPTGEFHP